MTKKHVFTNYCTDWESILSTAEFDHMLDTAHKQSFTEEAKKRVDFANYKDYGADESCPAYFGMFLEWFCGHFLNYFGNQWDIECTEMLDVEDSSAQDCGVDGTALTVRKLRNSKYIATGREPQQGSRVYIQVKATKNRAKMFSPNDGSRLPNFMTHAQARAMTEKQAYQARYLLFTSGKGIDYKLENMSCNLMEVINGADLKSNVKNNITFLNILRTSVGLQELPKLVVPPDQDAPVFTIEEIETAISETVAQKEPVM